MCRLIASYDGSTQAQLEEYRVVPGQHVLTWNYHQPMDSVRDIVTVSNIALEGTDQGIASSIQCSPGSFSSQDGAESCTPCSPGQFNSAPGATSVRQDQQQLTTPKFLLRQSYALA